MKRNWECQDCWNKFEAKVEKTRYTTKTSKEKMVFCPMCGSKELIGGKAEMEKK